MKSDNHNLNLEKKVKAIEGRNKRVELDKSWETSWTRRMVIIVLTYCVMVWLMWRIHVLDPWLNALVPTTGYFLSTLTLSLVRKIWERYRRK